MSEQVMYIYFDRETGRIKGISNGPDDNADYITVPLSQVIDIIDGKREINEYKVFYNSKTKQLELGLKYKHILDEYSVNDIIYEIPEINVDDADVTLIQDIVNSCWKVKIGEQLKNSISDTGANLTGNTMISITAKSDPTILYKVLFVETSKAMSDNYYKIPFTMPFETQDIAISAYTTKRFDTYQLMRIFDETV
jgi:hypothetical protein